MSIILPNLDDKAFADLVQEARASIPALYPAWTDHNPSDPGITLIELFAWLTEMVLYRNNRITESTYRTFLKLLVEPGALPELAGQPLDDAIRSTVLGLRQIYRAAAPQDYEALTASQWPGSPEAQALADALPPSQSMPVVRRVLCVGEHNLGPAASTKVNAAAAFTALATLSDGSVEDVTSVAAWDSSNAAVASAAVGAAMGHAAGAAHITASLGGVSGQATLTVGAATLVSIELTPSSPVAAIGRVVSFVATGTYSDGASADVTPSVTWSSSLPSVVAIDATGHARALAAGSSVVEATFGSVVGSTTVKVSSPALASISIAPAASTAAIGERRRILAVGHYVNGTVTDLTESVTWSSTTPAVAFVSQDASSSGLLTAAAGGTATLTATLGAVSGTASVMVSAAALLSIAVTASSSSLPAPATVALTALGTYSDGTVADITGKAFWSSSALEIASISSAVGSSGVATAISPGAVILTATLGGKSGTASITVTSATLSSIAITPSSPSVPVSVGLPLIAHGTYSDGSTFDITRIVSWTTVSASIASISTDGAATGALAGSTAVHAAHGAVTGSATLTVTPATLVSLAVTPSTSVVAFEHSRQMIATGTYSDGSTFDVTTLVSWSTGMTGVATVSNADGARGRLTATGAGTTSITATRGAINGGAFVTVPSIRAMVVSPVAATRPIGDRFQLTATAISIDGSTEDVTQVATFTSSDATVATMGAPGVAITSAPGATTITASRSGISGSTTLTVGSVAVTAISVIPKGAYPRAPGHVSLVVAPDHGAGAAPWLTPNPSLTGALMSFFEPRRLLTTHLHVTGPSYVPVTIAATIYLTGDADPAVVDAHARAALLTRFDPWEGGADGKGWPFGRALHASEVYAQLAQLNGVHHVDGVIVAGGAPPSDAEHVVLRSHQLLEVRSAAVLFSFMQPRANQWGVVSL